MSATFVILLLIVGIAAAWFVFGGNARIGTTAQPTPPQQFTPAFHWPDIGDYDFEVVGESFYQEILKALRGGPDEDGIGVAILVPEDENPHDNKAVKVTVQGLTIGYLSREDARSYRRRLGAKKLGMVPASCGLMITGGL
jgi:hypothetical protein